MRVGVYTDYTYHRVDDQVFAERAFALFLARLAPQFERFFLIGREHPEGGPARYPIGGNVEFVPLPFVHMASPIFLQHRARPGPTFREALLIHAVARIAYRGWIDNIQVSWVKMGVDGARQALRSGANDLGGTLMDENISRAAGASHGQELDEAEFRQIVEPLGRTLEQRTTLYGRTRTTGRRLRPPEDPHGNANGSDGAPVAFVQTAPSGGR